VRAIVRNLLRSTGIRAGYRHGHANGSTLHGAS
jgi:hypothetical protein